MNKDELKGKSERLRGKAKKASGVLTDDEDLYGRGEADEVRGEMREGADPARRKMGKAIASRDAEKR